MFRSSLFAVAGLALSASAFAMPKVGDQAVFEVVAKQGDQVQNAVVTIELTKFDQASNSFVKKETRQVPGQADAVEESSVDAAELATDAVVDELLSSCAAKGGTLEQVSVPAGSFQACKLPSEGGQVWIAKVSFAVVKAEVNQGGVNVTLSLRSFK